MFDTLSPAFPAFNSNKLAWVAGVGSTAALGLKAREWMSYRRGVFRLRSRVG